jgi:pilus assembly protein CpaB
VKTRLLTITLAAVLAMLGILAVLAYVRQANERAVNGMKAETVVVAAGAIHAGTSLSSAQQQHLLSTEKVPVSSLSASAPAVQSVTVANERLVLSGPVAKGQVLLQNMLGTAAGLAASSNLAIPPGLVAVTVNLCVSEAVADYLTPGSHVAVFDTVTGNGSQVQRVCQAQHEILNSGAIRNTNSAATLLVLTSAEVLAVGPSPASISGGNSAAVTTDPSGSSSSSSEAEVLVTLAVDQADAQRLILIDEVGLPYMALLGSDSSTAFGPPVNLFRQQQP